ncbi:hypothetical protein CISG_04596 [Coccidioides immitis RMSCC 3703]|uniref:Uncharacterized protein n=1 Tax=Coccidioides immitis RMSCC 3703 TaxID=454286 RepID=A0A0J8QP46_COCIT|nr:hypothetical protein CISG_04596 [Coccidioides immitis RMSCC 3703]
MPFNKDRLYVAVYFHKHPGVYHWAFVVSPKDETDARGKTTRYHVTNKILSCDGEPKATWQYEKSLLLEADMAKLLALVLVGSELEMPDVDHQRHGSAGPGYILSKSSVTDWAVIETECRAYASKKEVEGRYEAITTTVPTYDLMARKEIVP